jgi:hypothetical protein
LPASRWSVRANNCPMAAIVSASSPTSRRSHPGHTGGRQGWIVAAIEDVGASHLGGAGAAVKGSALGFLAVWLGVTAEVDLLFTL